MRKSEIISIVRRKTSEICEVKESSIISGSKCSAVVDARILMVHYTRRLGLTNEDIALFWLRDTAGDNKLCPDYDIVKRKAKTVHKLFNAFCDRSIQSLAFRLMSNELKEYCDDTFSPNTEN